MPLPPPPPLPVLHPPPAPPSSWVTAAPASSGWLAAPSTPGRVVPPAAGGRVVGRLAVAGAFGVLVLLASAIAALRVAGTYPSTVVAFDGPGTGDGSLWVTAFVIAMVVGSVLAARRYLDRARRRAGSDGIGAFVNSATGAVDGPGWQGGAQDRPLPIRSMRRTVLLAIGAAAVGGLILAAGQGVLWSASSQSALRTGSWLAIAGSLVLIAAAGLLPVVFRGTDRRLAEASRGADGGPVIDPGPRVLVLAPVLAIAIVGSAALAFGLDAADAEPDVCDVGPGWSCGLVHVPVDRDEASGDLVEVAYTIHPATARTPGEPRRVLVLAVGGPGVAGLPEAAWMYDSLDARVREQFDVVVYDPRSTGQSDYRDCPAAADAYYLEAGLPTAASARGFVDRCLVESGTQALDLTRFSTREVAEDIDALRDVLGVDRISLYGVSYGTVVAQAYAAAHPDRVEALVLDAPVDRSLPPAETWATSAVGFESALRDTLTACRSDTSCSEDLPDPDRAWSRLLGATRDGPLEARLFDADGAPYSVSVPRADLINMMHGAMYDTTDRMSFLRALAAFDRGDSGGFVRLWDAWSGESDNSSFAYFATWCADARHSPTPATDDLDAYLDVAVEAGVRDPGSLSVAYATAPCVYWPSQPAQWQPPAEATTVPTLILASTSDPITPVSEARAILGRHAEARLIETRGGAHGSLGDVCPMVRMTSFLVDGTLPASRTTTCAGELIAAYIPIAPLATRSPTMSSRACTGSCWATPWCSAGRATSRWSLGCAAGGTATFEPVDDRWRTEVHLDRCQYVPGAQLSGSGTLDLSGWAAELDLTSTRGDVRPRGRLRHLADHRHLGRAAGRRRRVA